MFVGCAAAVVVTFCNRSGRVVLVVVEVGLIAPGFDTKGFCSLETVMWLCPAWVSCQYCLSGTPMYGDGLSKASFLPKGKWQFDKPSPRSCVAGNGADAAEDTGSGGKRYPEREEFMVEVIVDLHKTASDPP